MAFLCFMVGAVAGVCGALAGLWKALEAERAESARLRDEVSRNYGDGYQSGYEAGKRIQRVMEDLVRDQSARLSCAPPRRSWKVGAVPAPEFQSQRGQPVKSSAS